MPELTVSQMVFLTCVVLFTLVAAVSDLRTRKIPNKITVPMCLAGLVYQISFFRLEGLWSALLGFAAGFGILFVLWMVGSAGGGDVKLMGALGPWLGGLLTLKVLFCSFIFVVLGTFAIVIWSAFSTGIGKTKSRYLKSGATAETVNDRKKRRVMAFAAPVALATWLMLAVEFLSQR
jgi:prepilin peptidase CpaA